MIPTMQTWETCPTYPTWELRAQASPAPTHGAQQGAMSARGHRTAIISFARLHPCTDPLGSQAPPSYRHPGNFLHSRPALPWSHQVSLIHKVAHSTCPSRKPSQPSSITAPLSPTLAGKKETWKHQTGPAPQYPILTLRSPGDGPGAGPCHSAVSHHTPLTQPMAGGGEGHYRLPCPWPCCLLKGWGVGRPPTQQRETLADTGSPGGEGGGTPSCTTHTHRLPKSPCVFSKQSQHLQAPERW